MKNQIISLETIDVNSLPELKGWKEKQNDLVKNNPFQEVNDNASYQVAKKRRTALVKGRTELKGQEKIIKDQLNSFKSKVANVTNELINITLPHEEKQQAEVKAFEKKKIEEKEEKIRIENERIEGIKDQIKSDFHKCKALISALTYSDLDSFSKIQELRNSDVGQYMEFTVDFERSIDILNDLFNSKKAQLQAEEQQRVENEKLKAERAKIEEELRIAREKAQREAEMKRIEQEKIDAENRKKEAELAKQQEEIEKEKKRLAQIEAEKKAKEEEERKAKEATEKAKKLAEIKAKEEALEKARIEALRPDKDKLSLVIEGIGFSVSAEVKDKSAVEFFENIKRRVSELKAELKEELSNLK